MKKRSKNISTESLLAVIAYGSQPMARRDIAKIMHIKGNDRIYLKMVLKHLVDMNKVIKKGKSYALAGSDKASKTPTIKADVKPNALIAEIKQHSDNKRIMGIFQSIVDKGTLIPTNRRHRGRYEIDTSHRLNAQHGDLVEAEIIARFKDLNEVRVTKVIGPLTEMRSPTSIAIHDYALPVDFSEEALQQADRAVVPTLDQREDLREIPFVTIDGEDAKDFDDAVWARPDPDINNEGGWHLMVAIADVSHYVPIDSALDHEAFERGNSVYFPDQVIPMLPEALSNGLCSLKPNEDRGCLAVEMYINHQGKLLRHKFMRGLMNSVGRLTYTQVQKAYDGEPTDYHKNFIQEIIHPLYGAFAALQRNREFRGTLDLNIPEQKVALGPDGRVTHITTREQLDSHKLIEEFMILANVSAAITLSDRHRGTLYRVHDQPNPEKVNALADFLDGIGLSFAKGQVMKPRIFNGLLKQAANTTHVYAINDMVLRTQAQAVYSPENIGHFGLSLARYCHFTSPIRRYADLVVHRGLINTLKLDDSQDYPYDTEQLQDIGEHISLTERRAAAAERATVERYISGYLEQRIGDIFECRISGVSDAGLFIYVKENGADGLIPIRTLPQDYYEFDRNNHCLIGRRRGRIFRLGETLQVHLEEANSLTGGLIFSIVESSTTVVKKPLTPKHYPNNKPFVANKHSSSARPSSRKKAQSDIHFGQDASQQDRPSTKPVVKLPKTKKPPEPLLSVEAGKSAKIDKSTKSVKFVKNDAHRSTAQSLSQRKRPRKVLSK